MDATRRSRRADAGQRAPAVAASPRSIARVQRAVADALRSAVPRSAHEAGLCGARIAIALSGGRDSMALLDATLALRSADSRALVTAIHVHHGLSPNADTWAEFCRDQCARRGVNYALRRVAVARSPRRSVEAEARERRHEALADEAAKKGAVAVLLAHHADDQAETLLLQLARGAGPRGLAAIAPARCRNGLWWLRPLLELPRAVIDEYVRERRLEYVDDESNASGIHRRNALRQRVVPALAAVAPGYPSTLVRAARLQAEASGLLDELATIDAARWIDGEALKRESLETLSRPRAANLLRWFLRERGLTAPSEARLDEMLRQLAGASGDARVALAHDGIELGMHRGRVCVHAVPVGHYEYRWFGASMIDLPHGTLALAPTLGEGVARRHLASAQVTVCAGVPGERLMLAGRARRPVADLLREAGIPAWERMGVPRLYCSGALAAVGCAGVDAAFAAAPGEAAVTLDWQPTRP